MVVISGLALLGEVTVWLLRWSAVSLSALEGVLLPECRARGSRAIPISRQSQCLQAPIFAVYPLHHIASCSSIDCTDLPAAVGDLATGLADYTRAKSVYDWISTAKPNMAVKARGP